MGGGILRGYGGAVARRVHEIGVADSSAVSA
jgi:hypothetical protein